jgi:hypothetical protein
LKFVAKCSSAAHRRAAMKLRCAPGWVAVSLFAAFSWVLVLAVSPALHETIHADASATEHTCAVVFVSSGSLHHSAPVSLLPPIATVLTSHTAPLAPQWVASPFLQGCIFEHAPPPAS